MVLIPYFENKSNGTKTLLAVLDLCWYQIVCNFKSAFSGMWLAKYMLTLGVSDVLEAVFLSLYCIDESDFS